jgi:hypothetical protein
MEDEMAYDSKTKIVYGAVAGVVADVGLKKEKNTPVVDARIDIYGPSDKPLEAPPETLAGSAHTDATGCYIIEGLQPGNYWASCPAFTPKGFPVTVTGACTANQDFQLEVGLHLSAVMHTAGGVRNEIEKCSAVEAGVPIKLCATYNHDLKNPVVVKFATNQGTFAPIPGCDDEIMLLTGGLKGPVVATVTVAEANSPYITESVSFGAVPAQIQQIGGNIGVTLQRPASSPTPDQRLWAGIRSHSKALSFGGTGISGRSGTRTLRGYQGFIEQVLCEGDSEFSGARPDDTQDPCGPTPHLGRIANRAKHVPLHGMAAYELLKTATEIFLLWNCGVAVRETDAWGNPLTTAEEESARTGMPATEVMGVLTDYLGPNRLPYIQRVVQTAFPGYVRKDSVFCTNSLTPRVDCVCLIELIWSYWHEEAMLVQTMNAISQRFQNVRSPGDRDPLSHVTIDPLRPLNNLLWGYVQDEQNRLTVKRRGAEYDHEYGLTLRGKAVPPLRPADSRSKFLEGFHNLLHMCSIFYKEDNDTTVIADGFPLLNALKEVHLLLAQGAHNQFGDLPWAARVEMLVQQWLLARPEMRDFLQSRPMVPYTEAWMPQVDTMKTLQGWSDVTVTHFHDLATFGEQILLSIRYGDWIAFNDENNAKNWARYWRPEIQSYIHAYRTVTGIDLTNPDTVDFTMPAVHLQKRLALQRAR